MKTYFDTNISEIVRLAGDSSSKRYRIRKHKRSDGDKAIVVPYITYKRKTRVLFKSGVTGAFINVGPDKVFFL